VKPSLEEKERGNRKRGRDMGRWQKRDKAILTNEFRHGTLSRIQSANFFDALKFTFPNFSST